VRIEVSERTLRAGIREFLRHKNWPRDFHADFYARQRRRRAAGLTEEWWSRTVGELSRWRAIRPLSRAEVRRRGLRVLSRLDEAYELLPAEGTEFGEAKWNDLSELFDVTSSIKVTLRPSPVFPSKLCHFIRPDLYVVVDREATGVSERYEQSWTECSTAWRAAAPIHAALCRQLTKAAGVPLPPTYPFATKITELCMIGTRVLARTVRRHDEMR